MKFSVNNRELAAAIVSSVEVATKNCIKDFNFENLITVKAEKDKRTFLSYGGTASLIASISDSNFGSINYKCEEEGEVTVKALDFRESLMTQVNDDIEVSLNKGEMVIKLSSNKSTKRAIALMSSTVLNPNIGDVFQQSVEIDREVFLTGLSEVIWAPAKEEKMSSYMCMLLETLENAGEQMVRFAAGSGGRFAIKAISGKNIYKASEDIRIIFPKNNLPTIHKFASSLSGRTVKIGTVEQNGSKNIPEQIMVECNGSTLSLFGTESLTKYPDMHGIINHQYPNRIYTDMALWPLAINGVSLSRMGHDSNIHNTEVLFESENERFMVTPQTAHVSTTAVNIVDAGDCVAKGDKIWFKCNSEYLTEMVQRAGKDSKVQFNFESQEILKESTYDDKTKQMKSAPVQMKPILVKFPEKSNEAKNLTENFYMFFTVSTK